jgi:hypothetical protein
MSYHWFVHPITLLLVVGTTLIEIVAIGNCYRRSITAPAIDICEGRCIDTNATSN